MRAGPTGARTAAETAARLVAAYGELRQVAALLDSLAAALSAGGCLPAALHVVRHPAFEHALHQVQTLLLG